MSRKMKYSLEEKLKGIKDYLSGKRTVLQICDDMWIHVRLKFLCR